MFETRLNLEIRTNVEYEEIDSNELSKGNDIEESNRENPLVKVKKDRKYKIDAIENSFWPKLDDSSRIIRD